MQTNQVMFEINASDETGQAFQKAESALRDLASTQSNLNAVNAEAQRIEQLRVKSLDSIIAAAYEESITFDMTAREIAMYKAQMLGATESQLAHIGASYDVIQAKSQEAKAMRTGAAATYAVQGASRAARAGIQQMGYQIQDIAVQLQGGASPFLVLSQQGSQIASIFGPGGAVAGALIAIGGIVAGTLFNSMRKTAGSTKDLSEEIKDLTFNLETATAAQIAFVESQDMQKRSEATDSIKEMTADIERLQGVLDSTKGALEFAVDNPFSAWDPAVPEEYRKIIASVTESLEQLTVARDNLQSGLAQEQERANREAESNYKKLIQSLESQTEAVERNYYEQLAVAAKARIAGRISEEEYSDAVIRITSDRAEKWLEIETKRAEQSASIEEVIFNTFQGFEQKRVEDAEKTARELIAIETMLQQTFAGFEQRETEEKAGARGQFDNLIEALMTEQELIEKAYQDQLAIADEARALSVDRDQEYSDTVLRIAMERAEKITEIEKKQSEERAALQQVANDAFLTNMNRQVDILQGAFDETTALGKAMFLFQQSMAAANAIINGYDAAMKIKAALPIGGDAMAAASIAMGFASAGAIMGQTLASFEGGGFTGYGPRVGGMDGKGGFLAMVHPNETITDHTKGGGNPVSVNININAMDKRGVSDFFQQNRPFIYREVRNAMNDRGRSL